MTLDSVADIQVLVSPVVQDGEIDEFSVGSDDEFSTRPVVCSLFNKVAQVLDVLVGDDFRHRHVFCYFYGDTQLVKAQVRVARNDRTRSKITTLAHKIASEAALFTLESFADGFQWLARLMLLGATAGHLVIHQCGTVELKHVS